jgi:hypothetical protein
VTADRYAIEREVYEIIRFYGAKWRTSGFNDEESLTLNAYSIHRASNQLNEACNKLWCALELAYTISPAIFGKKYTPIGNGFDYDFSLGTLIPSLYYSQISTLVSILSLFGVVSLYNHKTGKAYNLTRTKHGWRIYKRRQYLKRVLGVKEPKKGWHNELIQLFKGLCREITEIPCCNIAEIENLLIKRNKAHYQVLGDVSVGAVMGINIFFDYIPTIFENTQTAFNCLLNVWQPSSKLLKRFRTLRENIEKVYEAYGREFPNDFPPQNF